MPLSLGRRFILTALIGSVLPLGAIGLWVTRSAARSGRALVRSQLALQLAQSARDVERRWQQYRSELLTIGENEPVRLALLDTSSAARPVPPFVQRSFAQVTAFNQIVIRDRAGRARWTLDAGGFAQSVPETRQSVSGPSVAVQLPLTDLTTGDTIGAIDASLRVAAVLPSATLLATPSGPLTAVFVRDRPAAVPPGVDERVFTDETVEWGGTHWLAVRHSLNDPAIDLVMAGPLDAYVRPFARAASGAALALLGAATVIILVLVALTRRMTRDVERELAQREALAAVGEFASELAHEVRNPLTAMRLDLQRAEEAATDAGTVRGIIPRVLHQIDRLDRAVTGALRVARGGSIEARPVDIRAVLESARRAAEPELHRRGARVSLTTESEGELKLDGDAGALEQLFLNLLLNAAQALEPSGEVRVVAGRRNGMVEVTIGDNGSGMTPTQLEEVRQPFRSSRRDGTGLGLKIARRIVANHRGEMEVRSALGAGTTVCVRLQGR